jgi:hypothetical protein
LARTHTGQKISGRHNSDLMAEAARIIKGNSFRDLSTVWVTPTPDFKLDAQAVFQSWMPLLTPPNQKHQKLCIGRAEVGEAYNAAVEMILRDAVKWKYLLTVETDNLPPRDGLMKLYESVEKFDVIGGLYWMKGTDGHAHLYGDPSEPGSYVPQAPRKDTVQACNGLGMGFTLFNVDIFRKMDGPWFQTGEECTQDLFFFEKARTAGLNLRVGCDTRVKVGHIDFQTREIW